MKDRIVRKSLVVCIIILFILVGIYPTSAINTEKDSRAPSIDGNTLYVGRNGTGNYHKIQDAIDSPERLFFQRNIAKRLLPNVVRQREFPDNIDEPFRYRFPLLRPYNLFHDKIILDHERRIIFQKNQSLFTIFAIDTK